MNILMYDIFAPFVTFETLLKVLCFMRIGIGILTFLHGVPKIMGGKKMWRELGTFVEPLGIHFWPIMWGFLGACTEFLGGIALTIGFGTRIASAALAVMMYVAYRWHRSRNDSFNVYSFPLSLIVIFLSFMVIGSGPYSLDYLLFW